MAIQLLEISTFLASIMGNVFTMLDSVYIETNISMLDVFLALWFFESTVWFTLKLIGKPESNRDSGGSSGGGTTNKYQGNKPYSDQGDGGY